MTFSALNLRDGAFGVAATILAEKAHVARQDGKSQVDVTVTFP